MKAVRFLIAGCAALLMAACLPVTTKHPVGTTVGFKADPALLGLWKGHGTDGDAKDGWFAFLRNDDGSMTLILIMPGTDGDDWDTFRLRTATLGGSHVMNVTGVLKNGEPDDDELAKENIPLRYAFGAHGKLTLSLLDEKAAKAAIEAGRIAGTVGKGDLGDASITADPAALDAFFATKEGAALFGEPLVTLTKIE